MAKYLTAKRRAFVAEYLTNGRNGAAAHRSAFPGDASPRVRINMASRLLRDPRVAALIAQAERREALVMAELAERRAISRRRIAEALAEIAFARPGDYMSVGPDGILVYDVDKLQAAQAAGLLDLTIDERAGPDGQWRMRRLRVRFADRRAALKDLARLMGYFRDPHRPGAISSVADLTDAELDALRAEPYEDDDAPPSAQD